MSCQFACDLNLESSKAFLYSRRCTLLFLLRMETRGTWCTACDLPFARITAHQGVIKTLSVALQNIDGCVSISEHVLTGLLGNGQKSDNSLTQELSRFALNQVAAARIDIFPGGCS